MRNDLPLVLIVCNSIDDHTRLERRISSDSPAATRKIIHMCRVLKLAGLSPIILSLGRGRADGSGDFFSSKVACVDGIRIVYAPFSHRHVVSQLVSLFGLLKPLRRLTRDPKRVIVFYNRIPAYIPVLFFAKFLGYRCYLDLEDGEVVSGRSLKKHFVRLLTAFFDRYCRDGVLLACSALSDFTSVRPVQCYYGTALDSFNVTRFQTSRITCLMSGTLSPETGAVLLIETIRLLRSRYVAWASQVQFEVTGKGESLAEFERLSAQPGLPLVRVHGRTSNIRYLEILQNCDVGLALKPVGGVLADTTFPSKVVEFASSGLLVLSTDISDVRLLFGDGARYLEHNDPELLIERLSEIVHNREAAIQCAALGQDSVMDRCAPLRAGEELRQFLFEGVK